MNVSDMIFASNGTLEDIEKQAILIRLRVCGGNKTHAANSLKIAYQTLCNKLDQYEKEGQAKREREAQEQRERQETLNRMRGIGTAHEAQASGPMFDKSQTQAPLDVAPQPKPSYNKARR